MTRWRVIGFIGFGLLIFLAGIWIGTVSAEGTIHNVPRGSWIYQEMGFLFREGLIKNYPIDWVNSGNELSRFEIALYIKQFISSQINSEKPLSNISSEAVQSLQKLIAEFRTELGDLGIRIADIYKVSPKLVNSVEIKDGYQDLDVILSTGGKEQPKSQMYYYYGQYFKEMKRKSFVFIPVETVNPAQRKLLDGEDDSINILYQPKLGKDQSFLVVKGALPISSNLSVRGYYLFPMENSNPVALENHQTVPTVFNYQLLAMLEEVNQIQQIDSLWRIDGLLPLDGYIRLENDLPTKQLLGSMNQGMKIGGLLVYTDNPSQQNNIIKDRNGVIYDPTVTPFSNTVDLDSINGKYLQSLDLNLKSTIDLPSSNLTNTPVNPFYGKNPLGFDPNWSPTDSMKNSIGGQFQVNNYWQVYTYQSLVYSQSKTNLSTTAVGVEYNDWVTLWLAYQLLNFNDPIISGAVSFHF